MELKPKLIIVAGPNGSGKTSVTTKILKHEWIEGCLYINPDNIAKDTFGDWNIAENVLKAAKLAAEMRESCLKNRESLIFETVLSISVILGSQNSITFPQFEQIMWSC